MLINLIKKLLLFIYAGSKNFRIKYSFTFSSNIEILMKEHWRDVAILDYLQICNFCLNFSNTRIIVLLKRNEKCMFIINGIILLRDIFLSALLAIQINIKLKPSKLLSQNSSWFPFLRPDIPLSIKHYLFLWYFIHKEECIYVYTY